MRDLFELDGAPDQHGAVWPFGSRADHLDAGPIRVRLFRTDRVTRVRATLGLQYLDLARDCRYAWQFTGRPAFLLGLAAGLASTVITFVTAAAIAVALWLSWFGQPARLWIGAGVLLGLAGAVCRTVAEAFAPRPADVGPDAPAGASWS